MTEVSAWSPYVAVVALAASIGFNIWQAWDRHRERKPDVVVEVGHLAGSPSWPGPREGQHSGNDPDRGLPRRARARERHRDGGRCGDGAADRQARLG